SSDLFLNLLVGQLPILAGTQTNVNDTGIHVRLRAGKDGQLANQLIEEGSRTRADVFISEEPGPMGDLARRGLLVAVPEATLAKSDQRFVHSDGLWLQWETSSSVNFYYPTTIDDYTLTYRLHDHTAHTW